MALRTHTLQGQALYAATLQVNTLQAQALYQAAVKVYTAQAQVLYLPPPTSTFTRTVLHDSVVTDTTDSSLSQVRVVEHDSVVSDVVDAAGEISRSATHDNVVSDEVVSEAGQFAEADSVLLLTQDVFGFAEFIGPQVGDSLNLVQTVDVQGYEQTSSELDLQQSVDITGPVPKSAQSSLNLSQDAEFFFGLRWAGYDTSHDLGLTDSAVTPVFLDIEHELNLQEDAFRAFPVSHELVLNQDIVAGFGHSVENDLSLAGVAGRNLDMKQSVEHTSIVSQALAFFIESVCSKKEWGGFHGEGGTPPSDRKLTYDSRLLFQSIIDPTNIITLRNPETDDRRRVAFQRVNRNLFDGTPDIFRDPDWVTEETQLYTIVATKRDRLDTLWQFLMDNLGQEIMVKDWKGVTWKSVVTNPGEVYTEDAEGYWTLDFEVVGSAIDGEFASHTLDLNETLSRAGSTWTRQASSTLAVSQATVEEWDWGRGSTDPLGLSHSADYTLVA